MLRGGARAKKTRAMDMKTLSVRNKVEDMKVVLVYVETSKMIADIGTKALDLLVLNSCVTQSQGTDYGSHLSKESLKNLWH